MVSESSMKAIKSFYALPEELNYKQKILVKKITKYGDGKVVIQYQDEIKMSYFRAFGSNYDEAFWKMKGLLESEQIKY